jgi:ketosteroid isomerase-like protein
MSEQSVEVVKRAYAAFAEGDVPAVLAAFADDIEWHEAEGMPYGGLYRGGEAVVQNVFGPISQDVEGFALTPRSSWRPATPSPWSSATPAPGRPPAKRWTSQSCTSGTFKTERSCAFVNSPTR